MVMRLRTSPQPDNSVRSPECALRVGCTRVILESVVPGTHRIIREEGEA
jgi:hypothetical protein